MTLNFQGERNNGLDPIWYSGFYSDRKCKWENKDIVEIRRYITFLSAEDVSALSQIRHRNIVKIYGQDDRNYILMEYSDSVLLTDFLHGKAQQEYTVRDLITWMHQAAQGLQHIYIRKRHLIFNPFRNSNQNINPNILMLFNNFQTLKISLISLTFPTNRKNVYFFPKDFDGIPQTSSGNVYGLGIILWELMSRKIPFDLLTDNEIERMVLNGERPNLGDIHVPNFDLIKELIEKCWDSSPEKRPSIQKLLATLGHILRISSPSTLEHVLGADLGVVIDFNELKISNEKIFDGQFGVTYKATWRSFNISAKLFIKDHCTTKRYRELISIKRHALKPQNVVNVFGITTNGEYSYLLMEYVEGKSLFEYLQNATISVGKALELMRFLAEAIHFLIYEEGLSPFYICNMESSNITVSPLGRLVLCNFCLTFDINVLKENLSPSYAAPELFTSGFFTVQSIVYTFGIIFWEVLARKKAFYEYRSENSIRKAVKRGERPQLSDISFLRSDLTEFISKCLDQDPVERLKLKKLLQSLNELQNSDIELIKMINKIDCAEFEQFKHIGESKFGTVYKAVWRDLDVAIKTYKNVPKINLEKEIKRLLQVDHENVVKVYGICCVGKCSHLVMDYADCGSLHNFLHGKEKRYYTVNNVLHWMHQAAKGIAFLLHKKNILHCNINSQNMLLFENYRTLKVSDSYFPADQNSKLDYQDYAYVAPEILEKDSYSKESDVYSFGMVLWEAITRQKPFGEWKQPFSYKNITELCKGTRPPLNCSRNSQFSYIEDTIKKCWDGDPKKRPTIKELIELIQPDPEALKKYAYLEFEVVSNVNFSDISIQEKCVGKGPFGDIYKAKWCDREIAVEKYHKIFLNEGFQNEVRELSRINHANIIRLYGITFNDSHAFILMDYKECISVHNYLYGEENLEYTFARGLNWMIQCAKGLAYLLAMKPLPCINLTLNHLHLQRAENYRTLKICSSIKHRQLYSNLSFKPLAYDLGTILLEVITRSKDRELPDHTDFVYALRHIHHLVRRCKCVRSLQINCFALELIKILTASERSIVSLVITKDWWNTFSKDMLKKNNEPVEIVNFSNIEMGEFIDRGGFGTVSKAYWNGKTIAVKKLITIMEDQRDLLKKEIKIIKNLEHENIVKLFGVSYKKKSTYLLMEYADCGSLYNHLYGKEHRIYTMSDAINWMTQLIKGIDCMHGKAPPIIHRDLKPKNILLMNEYKNLKICDFGTVKELATNNTKHVGTSSYIAPEVYVGKYTEKCDIYSFGIILWEVMSHRKPFDHLGNNEEVAIDYQTMNKNRPKLSDVVPECKELHNLIEACWHHDPNQRPAASSIQLLKIHSSNIDIIKKENYEEK